MTSIIKKSATKTDFIDFFKKQIMKNVLAERIFVKSLMKEHFSITMFTPQKPLKLYHVFNSSTNTITNGYQWYSQESFAVELYEQIVKLWENYENIGFYEFYDYCQSEMCSDWSKQDEHGESFGGFWKDDTYKNNAWHMTRKKNILCAYLLPFPTNVIIEAIDVGCYSRMDNVRFLNYICEFVYCKYYEINNKKLPLFNKKLPFNFNIVTFPHLTHEEVEKLKNDDLKYKIKCFLNCVSEYFYLGIIEN